MSQRCGHPDCSCSTGIHESPYASGPAEWGLTFGRGELDQFGYWSIPCHDCARRAEEELHVPRGTYWPFPMDSTPVGIPG